MEKEKLFKIIVLGQSDIHTKNLKKIIMQNSWKNQLKIGHNRKNI